MMLNAISANVVKMPLGSNHHLLKCPLICSPACRVALAPLGSYLLLPAKGFACRLRHWSNRKRAEGEWSSAGPMVCPWPNGNVVAAVTANLPSAPHDSVRYNASSQKQDGG